MEIIPGIYIQGGKCVSWYKGYYNRQRRVYEKSPLEIAKYYESQGASRLNIIDLDASSSGELVNKESILEILTYSNLKIQAGGGIREMEGIQFLLHHKVCRVILGYSALNIIPHAVKRFGNDAIIAGIKAKKDVVVSNSLSENTIEVSSYAKKLIDLGITAIIYKDLESEGTMQPHYDEVDKLLAFKKAKIYLAGGISNDNQLSILKTIGLHGVIISKAFIEKKLALSSCIEKYQL